MIPVVFEEKHTHGVIAWWNLELKDRTPEWAEKLTELALKISKTLLVSLQKQEAVLSWVTPGAAMQNRGAYASFAAHALNGLVGSVDAVGGILQGSSVPYEKAPDLKPYLPAEFEAALKQKN